jgi:hypothetical protein
VRRGVVIRTVINNMTFDGVTIDPMRMQRHGERAWTTSLATSRYGRSWRSGLPMRL